MVAQSWEDEGLGVIAKEYALPFSHDKNVQKYTMVMFAHIWKYTKIH